MDAEARRRAAGDLETCFLVEAGAGTGKTTLLVERVLTALGQGIPLTRLVLITFTEASAADLRYRLRRKLEEVESRPGWARQALAAIDRAQISTIHAFAASLLREWPGAAGLPPSFTVVDELERRQLLERIWQEWLAGEAGRRLQGGLLRAGLGAEGLGPVREAVVAQADLLLGSDVRFPEAGYPDEADFWAAAREGLAQLRALRPELRDPADAGYQEALRLEAEWAALGDVSGQVGRGYLLQAARISAVGSQASWHRPAAGREHKEILKSLREALLDYRGRFGAALAAEALAHLRSFLLVWGEEKRRRGLVDFHDLLWRARDLLRDNPAVRRKLQGRYRQLMVDEFQDTDPLQVELVFYLAGTDPDTRDWRQVRLKPGRLLLVGDPKQSIYRFRRADIELFESVREQLAAQGEILAIQRNYRSRPGVLDWVNQVFSQLIQTPLDGRYQPHYLALYPAPERDSTVPAVWYLTAEREYGRRVEARRDEAEAVAAAILALYLGREPWPGPLPLSAMAVLLPNFSNLGLYQRALRRRGLPVLVPGGRGFYRETEVQAVLSVLRAVDHPEVALWVAGALRSAVLAVPDEDLVRYRLAGGQIFPLAPLGEEASPALAGALLLLAELHLQRNHRPPVETLETLLTATGFRRVLAAEYPEGLEHLARLGALARRFPTLRQFVGYLVQQQEGHGAEKPEEGLTEKVEAVRFITVHGSKGLEFEAVFMADLGAGLSGNQPLLVDREGGRVEIRLAAGYQTGGYEGLKNWENRRQEAEERRLFYVAATRAREHLIFSHFPSDRTGGFEGLLDGLTLPAAPELPWTEWLDLEAPSPLVAAEAAYPPTGEGTPTPWPEATEVSAGVRFGLALHAVLQEIPFTADRELRHRLCQRHWLREGLLGPWAELETAVERALSQPTLRRAARAERLWREVPYTLRTEDGYDEGRIDLLFEEEGEMVVVDYKTGEPGEHWKGYALQAQRYARALGEITGRRVREVVFLLATAGGEITWRPGTGWVEPPGQDVV